MGAQKPLTMARAPETAAPASAAAPRSGQVVRLKKQPWQLREEARAAGLPPPSGAAPSLIPQKQAPAPLPHRPAPSPHRASFASSVPEASAPASATLVTSADANPKRERRRPRAREEPGGACGCAGRQRREEPDPEPELELEPEGAVELELVEADEVEEGGPTAALRRWHWNTEQAPARAERVKLNAGGGLESTPDEPGKPGAALIPTEGLVDPYIDNYISAQVLNNDLQDVLMICTRTRNHNAVIYRARRKGDLGGSIATPRQRRTSSADVLSAPAKASAFDTTDPLDYFWYDNAPDFVAKRRAKADLTDRVEMNMFEKKGFGLLVDDERSASEGIVIAKMVAMPESVFAGAPTIEGRTYTSNPHRAYISREISDKLLVLTGYGTHAPGEFRLVECEDGSARFVTLVKNRECYAEKLYISTVEQRFNPIPKIMYVRLFGCDVETGEKVVQDFKQ